jgi:hypothetical protein
VCCQVEVSATSWSLVQRSPTDCGVSLCVIQIPLKILVNEEEAKAHQGAVAPRKKKRVTWLWATSPTQSHILEWRMSNSLWSVQKILLFIFFFTLGSRFTCVRQLPFTLCYIMCTSCCPYISGISQTDYYFLFRLLTGYPKLKFSGAMTFSPSLQVSWMNLCCEFYDGWLRTACNWKLTIVLLDQQMYQRCSATTPYNPATCYTSICY